MTPFSHVYINFQFKRMLGQNDFESKNLLKNCHQEKRCHVQMSPYQA